jgi:DNA invertase Pin-like site-specific DNA recombinase
MSRRDKRGSSGMADKIVAAIYARKSNKQDDRDDEAKSIDRQVKGARTFITAKAWSLDETVIGTKQVRDPNGKLVDRPVLRRIYEDDGVSGALFANREEFQRMMRDAERGHFTALVLFDLDRFGRDSRKSMDHLHQLADLGIAIWDYSTGSKINLDSFEGRISATLKAEFAQQFRDQVRKHTRNALRERAEKGWVAGGVAYGYDNVRIGEGHVELKINPKEARVVVSIYTDFANGKSAAQITATLNKRGIPGPRSGRPKGEGWAVSTVRGVLTRCLYKGWLIYGQTQNAFGRELPVGSRDKEKGQIRKSEDSWITKEMPHLRIIDDALALRVDQRIEARRERYAEARKTKSMAEFRTHGTYLLSGGMLRCSCGGNFEGRKYAYKKNTPDGHPANVYTCATRRRKPNKCSNTLWLPIEETDNIVLDQIEGEVLGTRYIDELLTLVETAPDYSASMRTERDRLQSEIDNLVKSIAAGVPGEVVAPQINANKAAIEDLDRRLRIPRPVPVDLEDLRAALQLRTKEWRKKLRAKPAIARMVLRQCIGPITLTPKPDHVQWLQWETTPKTELLTGLADPVSGSRRC